MREFIDENKKLIVCCCVLIIITVFLYILNIFFNHNDNLKYITGKDYVYNVEYNGDSTLPFINIDNESIQEINTQLKEDYYKIILYEGSYMKYRYSINNQVLSLVIEKGFKEDDESILEVEYETYNINIKTAKMYNQEELIELYHLDRAKIENTIMNDLKSQYQKEVNDGDIVGQECDFNCYIDMKEFSSIQENLMLAIDDNKVYGYLNLREWSIYYSVNNYPKTKTVYELN